MLAALQLQAVGHSTCGLLLALLPEVQLHAACPQYHTLSLFYNAVTAIWPTKEVVVAG